MAPAFLVVFRINRQLGDVHRPWGGPIRPGASSEVRRENAPLVPIDAFRMRWGLKGDKELPIYGQLYKGPPPTPVPFVFRVSGPAVEAFVGVDNPEVSLPYQISPLPGPHPLKVRRGSTPSRGLLIGRSLVKRLS